MTEHDEQRALMRWAEYQAAAYPELALLYAIPNGGHRNKTVAAKLKAEGVKPGVPDLCLPVPSGSYHGLYIELKAERGRVSIPQQAWIDALQENGYKAAVCHGWIEAARLIGAYLGLPSRCIPAN